MSSSEKTGRLGKSWNLFGGTLNSRDRVILWTPKGATDLTTLPPHRLTEGAVFKSSKEGPYVSCSLNS